MSEDKLTWLDIVVTFIVLMLFSIALIVCVHSCLKMP